jgi:hypothetical protein
MDERGLVIAAAAAVLSNCTNAISESPWIEPDYDYYDLELMLMLSALKNGTNVRVKCIDYCERVVPLYSCEDFQSHFRLTRESVEVSLDLNELKYPFR